MKLNCIIVTVASLLISATHCLAQAPTDPICDEIRKMIRDEIAKELARSGNIGKFQVYTGTATPADNLERTAHEQDRRYEFRVNTAAAGIPDGKTVRYFPVLRNGGEARYLQLSGVYGASHTEFLVSVSHIYGESVAHLHKGMEIDWIAIVSPR